MPAWEQTVDDGRFTCKVVTTDDKVAYEGDLVVTVTETGEEILRERVGISYGARFGPDVADVNVWGEKCLTVIDSWLMAHGESPPQNDNSGFEV